MCLTPMAWLWLGAALGFGATGAPAAIYGLLVAGAFVMVIAARTPSPPPPLRVWLTRTGSACLVGLVVLVGIQLLNPSHRHPGPGMHLLPLTPIAGLPSTVDRAVSLAGVARGALYALTFGLVWRAMPPARHAALLGGLVLLGALLALAGIAGRPTAPLTRQPMGPFGNENHFAACLNLLIPLALALTVETHRRAKHWTHSKALLPAAALGVLLAGVAVSASRAGILLAGALLLAWCLGEWGPTRSAGRPPQTVLAWSGAVLAIGLAIGAATMMISRGGPAGPWAHELAQRGLIWRGVLAMIMDSPAYGVGLGGFALAYPYYQPASLMGVCTTAHNDGLQLIAELGLVGSALLLVGVVAPVARLWRVTRHRRPTGRSRALVLGLLGLGLHAMVESPLRNPAVVVLACALAAIGCRQWAETPASEPGRVEVG